ncbi:winged helix-turn-helix domain-containing protein [Halorutilales archaeon Cl-col2-1]
MPNTTQTGVQEVLDALTDPDCREILSVIRETTEGVDTPSSLTAGEISDESGIPLSTTYRKLDCLVEASVVEVEIDVRSDARNTREYHTNFEGICVEIDADSDYVFETRLVHSRD